MSGNQSSHPAPSISNYDLTSMATDQFEQLESIFKMLEKYDNPTIKNLARTGQYLCQSWGGVYEWELECINHQGSSPKSAGSLVEINSNNKVEPVSETHEINTTVNIKALGAALYELLELNCFVADSSRLLQQEELMDDQTLVTPSYTAHLAAAIEHAARKELELHHVIQESIAAKFSLGPNAPNVQLFDLPSLCTFYYGGSGHQGVLKDE